MRSQDNALPKARASRTDATPPGYGSGRCSMKFPLSEAGEWSEQSSSEKGDVWMDGMAARRNTLNLLKAIEGLTPLERPSWIVDVSGVTVVWGDWSATAPTQIQAIFLMLEQVFPGGSDGN